jgi:hypothetical protein
VGVPQISWAIQPAAVNPFSCLALAQCNEVVLGTTVAIPSPNCDAFSRLLDTPVQFAKLIWSFSEQKAPPTIGSHNRGIRRPTSEDGRVSSRIPSGAAEEAAQATFVHFPRLAQAPKTPAV